MNDTPVANRIHIAFFGLRNAGKSTLINSFCGQPVAIVSDTPGTTTDPVSKTMEILPLGPCVITDTAGLDDEGELGELRVRKSLEVLAVADIAVWVDDPQALDVVRRQMVADECKRRRIVFVVYQRGDSVEELKQKIAAVRLTEPDPGLLDGLVADGMRVVLVCPIDESAPRGRLILPQVQVLRACLDHHLMTTVCQVPELSRVLGQLAAGTGPVLVITDSQAFREVKSTVEAASLPQVRLTSFSVLFARQKGNLDAYCEGLAAVRGLKSGDTVLIAEACTHHRQCNDIGSTKIPKALEKISGASPLTCVFASGKAFELPGDSSVKLVVHCGGCMITRREMQRRIELSKAANVPIVNYGILLAAAAGIDIRSLAACGK